MKFNITSRIFLKYTWRSIQIPLKSEKIIRALYNRLTYSSYNISHVHLIAIRVNDARKLGKVTRSTFWVHFFRKHCHIWYNVKDTTVGGKPQMKV